MQGHCDHGAKQFDPWPGPSRKRSSAAKRMVKSRRSGTPFSVSTMLGEGSARARGRRSALSLEGPMNSRCDAVGRVHKTDVGTAPEKERECVFIGQLVALHPPALFEPETQTPGHGEALIRALLCFPVRKNNQGAECEYSRCVSNAEGSRTGVSAQLQAFSTPRLAREHSRSRSGPGLALHPSLPEKTHLDGDREPDAFASPMRPGRSFQS